MEVDLADLWLAILLSAVFVFVASSVLHMMLPLHKSDYKKVSDEPSLLDALRVQSLARGEYMFPCAESMKDMGSPEMIEKMKRGPVGLLTIMPTGPMSMGKYLGQWFLYSILISVFAGYVGTMGLEAGAAYAEVFRLTGTVAILGYAVTYIPTSIWKGLRWGTTLKFIFDGVVYGLLTAGVFGWLWPAA